MIGASLISGQVDKRDFGKSLFGIFDMNLHNGMGPGRISICSILRRDSEGASFLNDIKKLIGRVNRFFFKANDVNIGMFVLPDLQFSPVRKKIKELTAIDFIKGNINAKFLKLGLD
jgi:hypothetical protein